MATSNIVDTPNREPVDNSANIPSRRQLSSSRIKYMQVKTFVRQQGPIVLAALVTIFLTFIAVSYQPTVTPLVLEVGSPSPQDFFSPASVTVVNVQATQSAREVAADRVDAIYTHLPEADEASAEQLDRFFAAVSDTQLLTKKAVEFSSLGNPVIVDVPLTVVEQVDVILVEFPTLDVDSVARIMAAGDASGLRRASLEMHDRVTAVGIEPTDLETTKNTLIVAPPQVIIPFGIPEPQAVRVAIGSVLSTFLQANTFLDEEATQSARNAARNAIPEVTRSYVTGERIIALGEPFTPVQLESVHMQGLDVVDEEYISSTSTFVVVAAIVLLLFLLMAAMYPRIKQQPRLLILVTFSVSMLAGMLRASVEISQTSSVWMYAIPSAGIAVLGAILLGPRFAILLTVIAGAIATLLGLPAGPMLFATLTMLAPIPLIMTTVTTKRTRLISAFLFIVSPVTAMVLGAHFSNFAFPSWELAVAGLVAALVSSMLLMLILPFAGLLFGVTTDMALLDLTDRNHPALRMLEEKAPGTFNHSLMVGSLAESAARAIGANPLLARAGAYYHDIGKTYAPGFFVENWVGNRNPHENMAPEDSADAIRMHVTQGLKLASKYRLPPEIRASIQQHHGSSLLRFFWFQASEAYEASDKTGPAPRESDFRYPNPSPQSREVAVLMLSDACEAATRALAGSDVELTPELISTLIYDVVVEKVTDNQLLDSGLTFHDMSVLQVTFTTALVGYYHDRVQYPGFPSTEKHPTNALPENSVVDPEEMLAISDAQATHTADVEEQELVEDSFIENIVEVVAGYSSADANTENDDGTNTTVSSDANEIDEIDEDSNSHDTVNGFDDEPSVSVVDTDLENSTTQDAEPSIESIQHDPLDEN